MIYTKEQVKDFAVQFIKITAGTTLEFRYEGPKEHAEKFIQRMRVHLSRMRKEVKRRGYVVSSFKMHTESIKEYSNTADESIYCIITLTKTAKRAQVEADVEEAFANHIIGERVNETKTGK